MERQRGLKKRGSESKSFGMVRENIGKGSHEIRGPFPQEVYGKVFATKSRTLREKQE